MSGAAGTPGHVRRGEEEPQPSAIWSFVTTIDPDPTVIPEAYLLSLT